MEGLIYLVVAVLFGVAWHLYNSAWMRAERIRRELRRQGIGGPSPLFLHRNFFLKESKPFISQHINKNTNSIIHDYASTIYPDYHRWTSLYGPVFLYTMGNVPILHVSEPELVKDMNLCKSLDLGKATYLQKTHEPLFGQGILKSNGESWAYQRKIIAPEFFMDKVKGMVDLMVDSAIPLFKAWERRIESEGDAAEIKIDDDLKSYSADVISRASFGSSYTKGKQIFSKLYELKKAVSKPNFLLEITGIRHIPTRRNIAARRLNKEIHSLILEVVKNGSINKKNVLQAILCGAAETGSSNAEDFVVDNCKTIYFAGHEATATTATWCLLLLALHPQWQDLARAEVVQLCAHGSPDAHSLLKMKTLTMVIQEVLRLYPPGSVVSREALVDMKLGGIRLPKGINIYIPVVTMHQDPRIWGADAHEFNPERFRNGIRGACSMPQMYMPFGMGPRTCLGQSFAMLELKIVLSIILQRFSFTLSPKYRHSPVLRLIVEPEHGVHLIMKTLHAPPKSTI